MNQCCFRWVRGAYSVKKTGEASSFYGPDKVKFCPECAGSLEKKETIEEDFFTGRRSSMSK